MKRILSVLAVVSAVLFLITGAGVLLLQDALKSSYLSGYENFITVYPINALVQLALTGIPCVVLAAIYLAGSHAESRGFSLLTCIYCSANLIAHSFLLQLISNAHTILGGRLEGVAYLANLSAVNSMFSQTDILANAALVFLLIISVTQLENTK